MKSFKIIIFSVVVAFFTVLLGNAVDSSMDNKDEMLCNSAKVSGNEEYLEKCICFYGGENIRCIYERSN